MNKKQPPRLMCGGLSGRIYVVTKYKELPDGGLEAIDKFDVTEDFDRLCTPLPPDPLQEDGFQVAVTDWEHGVRREGERTQAMSRAVAEALVRWFPDRYSLAKREVRRGQWGTP